jgi:glycosyltransferase involved in cell wall biosynthesis
VRPGPTVTLLAKAQPPSTGTYRYASQLGRELTAIGWDVRWRSSRPPWPDAFGGVARRHGLDIGAFWSTYPMLPPPSVGVLHLSVQTLATATALLPSTVPVVATIHDLLPYALRGHPELSRLHHPADLAFYRLAMRGLRRADALICISQYTADEAARVLGVPDEKLIVVPQGVAFGDYRPVALSIETRRRYGLDQDRPYVIFVGSEDPRKNLVALVDAIARVVTVHPRAQLLKVGPAHDEAGRRALVERVARLGLERHVRFLGHVPERDLPELYAASSVSVLPSLFEGYGLPVLEAMACGTPVVVANRTSLPEAAGDAGLVVDPTAEALAGAIDRVLSSPALAADLRGRGLRRAQAFTWRRTAEQTAAVYQRFLGAESRRGQRAGYWEP